MKTLLALFVLSLAPLAAQSTPQYWPSNGLPVTEVKTMSNNPGYLGSVAGPNWWADLHNTPNYGLGSPSPSAGLDVIIANDSLWANDYANTAYPSNAPTTWNTAVPHYSANRVAEQLRIYLQSRYGYGGTGLQPLIDVAQYAQVNPELYSASPYAIATSCLIGPQYGPQSWCSVVQMATGQVITWNAGNLPYNLIRTYCADNSSSQAISVAIDGTSVGTACGVASATPVARVAISSPVDPLTTHTATFTCVTGPCFMYGAEGRVRGGFNGDGNIGVRVHNLSVGSAPAEYFAGHTDFEDLISNGTGYPNAQLVIYAMGTNETGLGIPLATYEASVASYIGHELGKNSCPGAATACKPTVIIYRPGMDSIASSSYFSWLTGTYAPSQNLLVIDQTNRWGKAYIPGAWMMGSDGIHFNDAGNLDEAHTLLSALIDSERSQAINPVFGDTSQNPGFVGVTAPAYTAGMPYLAPGYGFLGVPGVPDHTALTAWQTGQSSAGWVGLFSPADPSRMQWGEDAIRDFCIHGVLASGACSSYHFYVDRATGAVKTTYNTLDDGSGNTLLPGIKATTGARYVCVDTTGKIVSSASACSGT